MKNLYLIILVFLASTFLSRNATSQTTIVDGNIETNAGPLNVFYNYGLFQHIYTSSEVGAASILTGLQWEWDGSAALTRTIKVWIGNTLEVEFNSNGSDAVPTTSMTLVYDGTIDLPSGGTTTWEDVIFNQGFSYDGTSNLVIAVEDNTGSYVSGTSTSRFFHIARSNNDDKTLYQFDDTQNSTMESPSWDGHYDYTPSLKLYVLTCDAPTSPTSSLIAATTATISWSAPASAPSNGYAYYYSASSTDPGLAATASGTVAAGVLTKNLTGLASGTTYYYWIRSDCGSGDLSVWTSSGNFTTTVVAPTVSSFTPSNGCAGETVVITGTNFGGTSAVTIGATAVSSYTVDSDTQITATVGSGTAGVIQITNSAGSASSSGSFTFNSAASITTEPETTVDIAAGNSDVISVVASGATSYQWQFSEDGSTGWEDIVDGTPANVTYSGATTANLTVQPNTSVVGATGYYKCVVHCGNVSVQLRLLLLFSIVIKLEVQMSGVLGVTFGTMDNTTGNPYNVPLF